MRIAVTAALLASMIAGPAMAQAPSRPAAKAPQAKSAPAKPVPAAPAKPSLTQMAAQGDAQAQYQLGQATLTGKGAKKNAAEAVSWFALAAGNGVADAAIALARAYEQGSGVPRDPSQAAEWWLRAGILGDAAAKARFIELFLSGQAQTMGGPTGAAWLEEVASSGDSRAVLAVGRAYEQGQGVLADPSKARDWYLKAALAGNPEAQFRLGLMLLREPGAWRLIYAAPEEEAKNENRGVYYPTLKIAKDTAKGGQIPDIVRPGLVEGETWLRAAAAQGHAEAQYALGSAFLGGMDLPFDLIEAVHWLSAAAFLGHPQALMDVADLAAKGQGFGGKDPVRAWVAYDLAAGGGVKPAEEARESLGKTMTPRQLGRARQLVQDIRGN